MWVEGIRLAASKGELDSGRLCVTFNKWGSLRGAEKAGEELHSVFGHLDWGLLRELWWSI